MEKLESLWQYCTDNNRLVPVNWYKVTEMLPTKPDGIVAPAPFILAALSASNEAKQFRFKEHLVWASETGVLEKVSQFLRSLPEDHWNHF
jgi:hypothetical protein